MEQDIKKKHFNRRAFVAIAMFTSGSILPFSGIMNHRLQFETLQGARHFWMSVHNMSAVLFTVFAIVHIIYNWHVLTNYSKRTKEIILSKEAIAAIIIVIFIVGIFSTHALHGI